MTQNDKRFCVFISSTFLDLKDYREAVRKVIHNLKNHANDMIYWSADERDPKALSLDELRHSDIVILLVAHRYGTIPNGETRSITEIEFETAKAANLPILAFFVDRDYEWPGSRFEPKDYDKLTGFKEKVGQHCTPQYFTSTDSLEALVTQALVNFDKRNRAWLTTHQRWMPTILVNPRQSLEDEANTLVPIGLAEDGLRLILSVARSDSLDSLLVEMAKLLGTIGETGKNRQLDAYLNRTRLLRDAEEGWRKRGSEEVKADSGQLLRCYITKKTISDLLSSSLLTSLLPIPIIGDYPPIQEQRGRIDTRVQGTGDARVQSTGGRNRFLAIAINGEEKFVVGKSSANNADWQNWHDFHEESLHGFSDCDFVFSKKDKVICSGTFNQYPMQLKQSLESNMDESGKATFDISFQITRAAVGKAICQILLKLEQDYHRRKIIHGDVRPQNCLVSAKGAWVIDSLELGIGEVSPALTPAWAAPEQVAMRPVSTETDIYPIGLMLVSLLGGQITGEIVRYQLPSETNLSSTIAFIRDPYVYLNPKQKVIPQEGQYSWMTFIEKCLRFDPRERFPTAPECSSELSTLLAKYPPEGRLSLQLNRGQVQVVGLPSGAEVPCRIVSDDPYGNDAASRIAQPNVLLKICPSCQTSNVPGVMYCDNCGASIQ